MKVITCIACEDEFDLHCQAKKDAGGLATTCPDCSEESTIKYAGVQSADGKQNQATILKFTSEEDKAKYLAFWKNNSGGKKGGYGCQLGSHLSTTPDIKFETINEFIPTNHKGKA